MQRAFRIGVIGASDADASVLAMAEQVGAAIAKRGAVLVCGGRGGVMQAACKGAKSMGGTTVGVLPGDDAGAANDFVDIPIVTAMGEARNAIIARTSQALIAISGGYGTLSEIALGLQFGRPVIGLGTWALDAGHRGAARDPIIRTDDPERAVALAMEILDKPRVRVLFAENHAVFANLAIDRYLGDHDVTLVTTISDAMKAAVTSTFDVVLVDYSLDDGTGDTLIRALRDRGVFTPVVAISGQDEGNQALVNAGANAVCRKAGFSSIASVLKSLLDA